MNKNIENSPAKYWVPTIAAQKQNPNFKTDKDPLDSGKKTETNQNKSQTPMIDPHLPSLLFLKKTTKKTRKRKKERKRLDEESSRNRGKERFLGFLVFPLPSFRALCSAALRRIEREKTDLWVFFFYCASCFGGCVSCG